MKTAKVIVGFLAILGAINIIVLVFWAIDSFSAQLAPVIDKVCAPVPILFMALIVLMAIIILGRKIAREK